MIPDPARSSPAGNASPTGNAGETIAGDYDRLRNRVGTVPIGRDAVAVRGPDATAYLQGQCSQDVERLAEGASVDALLLSPQGKIDALVRVTRRAPDDLLVDVDEGHGAAVIDRLLRFRLRVKVAGSSTGSMSPFDGDRRLISAITANPRARAADDTAAPNGRTGPRAAACSTSSSISRRSAAARTRWAPTIASR